MSNININVALSASSGLSLRLGKTIIWIDAIHSHKTESYSTVTPTLWEHMKISPAFIGQDGHGPDMIAFTHCHTDHFDPFMCREAKSLWPDARLVLPERYFPEQIYIDREQQTVNVNDINVEYIKAKHTGKEFVNYPSYFININYSGINILITGDTAVSDSRMPTYYADKKPDIAFMNYSWMIFKKCRTMVEEKLCPKHLFIVHAPFENDDTRNILRFVRNGMSLLENIKDVKLMCEPYTDYAVNTP